MTIGSNRLQRWKGNIQRIALTGAIWAEGEVGKGATFHFTLD